MPQVLSVRDRQLDSRKRATYVSNQFDPIVGQPTGRWILAATPQDTKSDWTVTLRNLPSLKLGLPGLDWQSMEDIEPQSQALYKYSAGFLPSIFIETANAQIVTQALETLFDYLGSPGWQQVSSWMTSLDHCIAMRLRSMSTLTCLYQDAGLPTPDALLKIVELDVNLVLTEKDTFFPQNNHGAMMAIALIHVNEIFKIHEAGPESSSANPIPTIAWTALQTIITLMFDEFGVASENSPAYQRYWIDLLKPLGNMVHDWPIPKGDDSGIEVILEKAESALSFFTDNRGKLLPIGDSHANTSGVSPAKDGVLFTPSRGFMVYRRDETVFSFNCGSDSYAHKHCDDTSVTLSARGVDLILDAGFYGHDWNDPRVIYTKSQSAHSGLFLATFDDLHPGKLYFPGRTKLFSTLTDISKENPHFEAEVRTNAGDILQRSVRILGPHAIELVDSIHTETEQSAVRRFLIPSDSALELQPGSVSVTRKGVRLSMCFDPEALPRSISVYCGSTEPNLRGWISPKAGVLEPCYCVEIPLPIGVDSTLNLNIEHFA